jgi:hypothetical protein
MESMPSLEEGPKLSWWVVRRLACDSVVKTIIESDQVAVGIGRRVRIVSPALRKVLIARDRHCRFPGCNRKRFADMHHIRHWADGGPTTKDNLVMLCRFHHKLVHDKRFQVIADPKEGFRFVSEAGIEIKATPASTASGHDLTACLLEDHARRPIAIDSGTAQPRFGGERYDLGLTIDGLMCLRYPPQQWSS